MKIQGLENVSNSVTDMAALDAPAQGLARCAAENERGVPGPGGLPPHLLEPAPTGPGRPENGVPGPRSGDPSG